MDGVALARLLVSGTPPPRFEVGSLILGVSDGCVAVVGLGYVGLPLAVEFGKKRQTIGFDVDSARVARLLTGHDSTREVSGEELASAAHLTLTDDPARIRDANIFIVTVPTPIDQHKRPDLGPLYKASETIGAALKRGDIVIYESTVYPGATEEECVPVLERVSGLSFNIDFFVGYSPERVNPGDKEHRLPSIRKVTSGSTPETAHIVDALYREVIVAGTHPAQSIRVAEAAKVIENTQRDINIALVNELAIIFNRLGIDTGDVLAAAGSKWNFLPFQPGLVGGHCIGVDPYYLTHKAQEIGYHPQLILAGRRLNDSMGVYAVSQLIKLMTRRDVVVGGARVLLLGLAFKENCPDLRNTRAIDIVRELQNYSCNVDVYDPWVSAQDAQSEYGVSPVTTPEPGAYDAIVLAVAHSEFLEMGAEKIRAFGKKSSVFYDLKRVFPANASDLRL